MKKILTIAGYDPSSGAGITKDLETFSSLGIHGISVPTCIVLQGPLGVRDVHPVPYPQFYEMIDMAKEGSYIDGIKIGVVWNEAYVEKIASFLSCFNHASVVVDPVVSAKNGTRLLTDEGLRRLVESVFPLAGVVTPNIHEASLVTGKRANTLKDMKDCAKEIFDMGPKAVIVKGGHLKGEPVDLLFDGEEFVSWKKHRIDREVHGTGCMFSSLMISFLVHGYDRKKAFVASEKAMEDLLGGSYRIDDDGYFYASPGILNSKFCDRRKTLRATKGAQETLQRVSRSTPEYIKKTEIIRP